MRESPDRAGRLATQEAPAETELWTGIVGDTVRRDLRDEEGPRELNRWTSSQSTSYRLRSTQRCTLPVMGSSWCMVTVLPSASHQNTYRCCIKASSSPWIARLFVHNSSCQRHRWSNKNLRFQQQGRDITTYPEVVDNC